MGGDTTLSTDQCKKDGGILENEGEVGYILINLLHDNTLSTIGGINLSPRTICQHNLDECNDHMVKYDHNLSLGNQIDKPNI
jgi:hypothetical protein